MSEATQQSVTGISVISARVENINVQLLDLQEKVYRVTAVMYSPLPPLDKPEEATQPYAFQGQCLDIVQALDRMEEVVTKLHEEINRF